MQLLREMLQQLFVTPVKHHKSKPFVDHVISFYVADGRIWLRNYQASITGKALWGLRSTLAGPPCHGEASQRNVDISTAVCHVMKNIQPADPSVSHTWPIKAIPDAASRMPPCLG